MPKNVPGRADHGAPQAPLVHRYRKAIAAACGMAATLAADGWFDGRAEALVQALLGVATVLGVYASPNASAAPDPNLRAGH